MIPGHAKHRTHDAQHTTHATPNTQITQHIIKIIDPFISIPWTKRLHRQKVYCVKCRQLRPFKNDNSLHIQCSIHIISFFVIIHDEFISRWVVTHENNARRPLASFVVPPFCRLPVSTPRQPQKRVRCGQQQTLFSVHYKRRCVRSYANFAGDGGRGISSRYDATAKHPKWERTQEVGRFYIDPVFGLDQSYVSDSTSKSTEGPGFVDWQRSDYDVWWFCPQAPGQGVSPLAR